MKRSLLNFKFFALFLALIFAGTVSMAQRIANASGNWNAPGTWQGGIIPSALDNVVINNGVTVTVNVANAACASVTINNGGNNSGLTVSANSQLTVSGNTSVGVPDFFSGANKTLSITGGGTMITGTLTVDAEWYGSGNVSVSNGTLIVTGNVIGSFFSSSINVGAPSTFKLGGTLTSTDFNLAANSTFEYIGTNQSIYNLSYSNLVIDGNGTKTISGNRNASNSLLITEDATITLGSNDLTVSDGRTMTVNGRVNINNNGRLGVDGAGGSRTLILGSSGYISYTDNGNNGFPSFGTYTLHPSSTIEFGSADAQTIPTGITYGNIITSGSNTKTLQTAGGSINIAGSITIGAGTTLNGNGKTINVGGDFTRNGSFTQTNTTLVFNGSSTQTVSGSSALALNHVTINGAGGISLSTNASVNNLALTNGVVTAPSATLTVNGAISGGSSSSYVNGALSKVNVPASAYVMPVGNAANGYRPITVTPSNATSTFTAQSFSGNPKVALGETLSAPLKQLSNCEYWTVTRPAGTASATVTMSWSNAICGGSNYVGDLSTLLLARFSAGTWSSQGQLSTSGTTANGTITANAGAFGSYALGTSNEELNPLPVTFNNVRAFEKNNGVQIEWSNMTEKDVIDYTVERSTNGQTYSVINTQTAKSNQDAREDYLTFDASPVTGVNYYRIKVRETTGKMVYSKVLKVEVGGRLGTFTVYPNPVVGGQMTVGLSGVKGTYNVQVVNAGGQVIMTRSLNHAGGNMSQQVALPGSVKPGVYSIVISGDNYREAKMFVVQ